MYNVHRREEIRLPCLESYRMSHNINLAKFDMLF